jgi:hypothetical protein
MAERKGWPISERAQDMENEVKDGPKNEKGLRSKDAEKLSKWRKDRTS